MTPLLLVIPLVAAAPIPKELKPKDRPTLDGTWRMTGILLNGRQFGGNQNSTWKIEGETLVIENFGRVNPPRPIKTNPKANPPEFQLSPTTTQLGIYEIKDDTLTIAISQEGNVRPAGLDGPNAIVYTFTRVKDAPGKGK